MGLAIRRRSTIVREALIRDRAKSEGDLSAAEIILIDKSIALLQITWSIEAFIRKNGVMKGGRIREVLLSYGHFVNSLRLIFREIGISKKAQEDALDLKTYIAKNYPDKDKTAKDEGKEEEGDE
jgi:hypothetical protein